tara:strand:+ start:1137 stop:2852 length:1716 start_codon:yes stop_codon:yes gene_type:complete
MVLCKNLTPGELMNNPHCLSETLGSNNVTNIAANIPRKKPKKPNPTPGKENTGTEDEFQKIRVRPNKGFFKMSDGQLISRSKKVEIASHLINASKLVNRDKLEDAHAYLERHVPEYKIVKHNKVGIVVKHTDTNEGVVAYRGTDPKTSAKRDISAWGEAFTRPPIPEAHPHFDEGMDLANWAHQNLDDFGVTGYSLGAATGFRVANAHGKPAILIQPVLSKKEIKNAEDNPSTISIIRDPSDPASFPGLAMTDKLPDNVKIFSKYSHRIKNTDEHPVTSFVKDVAHQANPYYSHGAKLIGGATEQELSDGQVLSERTDLFKARAQLLNPVRLGMHLHARGITSAISGLPSSYLAGELTNSFDPHKKWGTQGDLMATTIANHTIDSAARTVTSGLVGGISSGSKAAIEGRNVIKGVTKGVAGGVKGGLVQSGKSLIDGGALVEGFAGAEVGNLISNKMEGVTKNWKNQTEAGGVDGGTSGAGSALAGKATVEAVKTAGKAALSRLGTAAAIEEGGAAAEAATAAIPGLGEAVMAGVQVAALGAAIGGIFGSIFHHKKPPPPPPQQQTQFLKT